MGICHVISPKCQAHESERRAARGTLEAGPVRMSLPAAPGGLPARPSTHPAPHRDGAVSPCEWECEGEGRGPSRATKPAGNGALRCPGHEGSAGDEARALRAQLGWWQKHCWGESVSWFRGMRLLGRMARLAGGLGEALCHQLGAVPLPTFPSDTFAALAGGGGRSFPSRLPSPVRGSWRGRLLSVPKSGWCLT